MPALGVDVIVGFPGETDEHFLETYRYLNEMDISYLHVFKSILNVTILKQQKC
jgi:tRNA A37 methylthiotransferase MiaB